MYITWTKVQTKLKRVFPSLQLPKRWLSRLKRSGPYILLLSHSQGCLRRLHFVLSKNGQLRILRRYLLNLQKVMCLQIIELCLPYAQASSSSFKKKCHTYVSASQVNTRWLLVILDGSLNLWVKWATLIWKVKYKFHWCQAKHLIPLTKKPRHDFPFERWSTV